MLNRLLLQILLTLLTIAGWAQSTVSFDGMVQNIRKETIIGERVENQSVAMHVNRTAVVADALLCILVALDVQARCQRARRVEQTKANQVWYLRERMHTYRNVRKRNSSQKG